MSLFATHRSSPCALRTLLAAPAAVALTLATGLSCVFAAAIPATALAAQPHTSPLGVSALGASPTEAEAAEEAEGESLEEEAEAPDGPASRASGPSTGGEAGRGSASGAASEAGEAEEAEGEEAGEEAEGGTTSHRANHSHTHASVRITRLQLTHATLAALAHGPTSASRVAFSFTASGAAKVSAHLERQVRRGGQRRFAALADAFTTSAKRGSNRGHLRGHDVLAAGTYRLELVPAHGRTRTLTLHVA